MLEVLRHGAGEPRWIGAAVNVMHTWGDLLDFHPHVHALVAWGLFDERGDFHGAPPIPAEVIRDLFMHKVFKLMLQEGVITEDLVADMRSWPHSGFHAWVGPLVSCLDARGMENMSQYTARGPISLDKLDLVPGAEDKGGTLELEWPEDAGSPSAPAPSGRLARAGAEDERSRAGAGAQVNARVICRAGKYIAKHKGDTRVFDPLSFIAELTTHIPNHHQKMAIYYGRYSNRSRGLRKKAALRLAGGQGQAIPPGENALALAPEPEDAWRNASKANWARFIKKVYEVDPLRCHACPGTMRIVAFIVDTAVIYRILKHLDLLGKDPPSPNIRGPPATGTAG